MAALMKPVTLVSCRHPGSGRHYLAGYVEWCSNCGAWRWDQSIRRDGNPWQRPGIAKRKRGSPCRKRVKRDLARVGSLDPSTVTGKKLTLQPPLRTRSGYGSKLPTSWMLRIGKRWHRVYLVCWSNSGSLYIRSKGKSLFLGDYSWQLTPFDESQNNET